MWLNVFSNEKQQRCLRHLQKRFLCEQLLLSSSPFAAPIRQLSPKKGSIALFATLRSRRRRGFNRAEVIGGEGLGLGVQ